MTHDAKHRPGDQTDAKDSRREPHPQDAVLVVVFYNEVVSIVRSATSGIRHLYDFRAGAWQRLLELRKVRWVWKRAAIVFLLYDGNNLFDDLATLGRVADDRSELMLELPGDLPAGKSLVMGQLRILGFARRSRRDGNAS